MKPRQWILMISLVSCLSVAVPALPQNGQLQPDGNGQTILMAASAPESAMALVGAGQAGAATGPPPRPSEAERTAVANRPPIRTIHDARHVFAAIDIDPIRGELVAGDENNFSIVVYDRMTNTPPTAAFSEPRRVIQGESTFLEYVCGIYIDPESGDIYAINNDTLNYMTVWGRDAQGDVAPKRKLATPHTTVRMSIDEATQEIFMTVQDDHAISVFRKAAEEEEDPLRLIQGSATRLADPHGIVVDSNAGLIFVTNWGTVADRLYDTDGPTTLNRGDGKANWPVGREANIPGSGRNEPPSITVYRKDASGNVAPLRVIQGPNTGLNWPTDIAVHPERGEIFVANDTGHSITVYSTDADGDAAPIRVLQGPNSLINHPVGVKIDLTNDELWVANLGSHSATVYDITAEGDPTPTRVIRSGPADSRGPMLANVHTITYDTRREEILGGN
jgi:6-phosphogluconolactonase (cycloisomerase 2 family)